MYLGYAIAPVAGYIAAGLVKFVINSLKAGRPAFDRAGLGGMPSTHTTVVATPFWLIAFRGEVDSAAFSVAAALLLVVALDAMDLRQRIGAMARHLQRIAPADPAIKTLRTQLGHTPAEVIAGLALGASCAGALTLLQI